MTCIGIGGVFPGAASASFSVEMAFLKFMTCIGTGEGLPPAAGAFFEGKNDTLRFYDMY